MTFDGPWYSGDGRIGAISFMHLYEDNETWIQVLEGPKRGTMPKPTALPNGVARLGLHTTLALPTGQLITYGIDTLSPDQPMAIERWEPGQANGVIETLPSPPDVELRAISFFGRAATEIYAAGEMLMRKEPYSSAVYLARFDGKVWSRLEAPAGLGRETPRFAMGEDGVLWMLREIDDTRLGLFRRAPDGAWSMLALPPSAGTKAGRIVVLGTSDVWIVGITGGWAGVAGEAGPPERFVVSRSQPVSAVLRL